MMQSQQSDTRYQAKSGLFNEVRHQLENSHLSKGFFGQPHKLSMA
jgi:hypothetical protein